MGNGVIVKPVDLFQDKTQVTFSRLSFAICLFLTPQQSSDSQNTYPSGSL